MFQCWVSHNCIQKACFTKQIWAFHDYPSSVANNLLESMALIKFCTAGYWRLNCCKDTWARYYVVYTKKSRKIYVGFQFSRKREQQNTQHCIRTQGIPSGQVQNTRAKSGLFCLSRMSSSSFSWGHFTFYKFLLTSIWECQDLFLVLFLHVW